MGVAVEGGGELELVEDDPSVGFIGNQVDRST